MSWPDVARGVLLGLWLLPALALGQTTPITVTVSRFQQIGDGFDVLSLGDMYARITIDGGNPVTTFDRRFSHDFSGYIVPTGWMVPPAPWVVTEQVPFSRSLVDVRLELFDDDAATDNDQADINPGPKEVVDIVVDLSTGKWTGDVNWPQSCVTGPNDLGGNSAGICFDISVLSATGDADGDALLDGWELLGYNDDLDETLDVDLPGIGANALRKDLFVELDALLAPTHSHVFSTLALTDIVTAFARAPVMNPDGTTGIQLHLDIGSAQGAGLRTQIVGPGGVTGAFGDFGGGGVLSEAGNEVIRAFNDAKGTGGTLFSTLAAVAFDSSRAGVFRYAISGHQTNARREADDCTSGQAIALPGGFFIVTLGGTSPSGNACWSTDLAGNSVGSRAEQAGTFLHELGHTLGLGHGGGDGVNKKPNYLSVMSYSFQACSVAASPDGRLPGGCDYSRFDLGTLNETTLDECQGLDFGELGFGPMDWDGDGTIEGPSACSAALGTSVADLNNDGVCVEPGADGGLSSTILGDDVREDESVHDGQDRVCQTAKGGDDVQVTAVGSTPMQPNALLSFEDWNNLVFSTTGQGGQSGAAPSEEPDPESIRAARSYLSQLTAPGIAMTKSGPATAVPGDLLTFTVELRNTGRGPALQAVLSDGLPDGGVQVTPLGALTVGSVTTRTSSFLVPQGACPGDVTGVPSTLSYTDLAGDAGTASAVAPLQILDVSAPSVSLAASPSVLWPPNHTLRDIAVAVAVEDNCDPNPSVQLLSITSNEPQAGFLGMGDQGPDIVGAALGTDDRGFALRAERGTGRGHTGRVYRILYRVTDASGNATERSVEVTVPTSQGS